MRNNKIGIIGILIIAICVISAGTAFAFNHYQIDVDAIKEITKEDTFEVRVTGKAVKNGTGSSMSGTPDTLILDVVNESETDSISGMVILLVAYNEEGKAQSYKGSGGLYIASIGSGTEKRELHELNFEDLSYSPESAFQLTVPCDYSLFSGVQVLVAQYTTADGEVKTNPLLADWRELALGSPTHILD